MRCCIGFALISSVIDRESSGHPLNQSDVKIKNKKKKATWVRKFFLTGLFLL